MQIKMLELHFPLYIYPPPCCYCKLILLVYLLDYCVPRLIRYLQEEEKEEEVLDITIQVIE